MRVSIGNQGATDCIEIKSLKWSLWSSDELKNSYLNQNFNLIVTNKILLLNFLYA